MLAQADPDANASTNRELAVSAQPEQDFAEGDFSPDFGHGQFEQPPNEAPHPAYSLNTSNVMLSPARSLPKLPSTEYSHRQLLIGSREEPKYLYRTFPNTPVRSSSPVEPPPLDDVAPEGPIQPEEEEDDRSRLPYQTVMPSTSSEWKSWIRRTKNASLKFIKTFHKFMTAPLYAALASFIVALIPPLQHLIMENVTPVRGFLASAGACSIPLTMLVLGAYFYEAPQPTGSFTMVAPNREVDENSPYADPEEGLEAPRLSMSVSQIGIIKYVKNALRLRALRWRAKDSSRTKKQGRPGETTTVVVACLARMIVTPAILLPTMGVMVDRNVHPLFEE